MTEWLDDFYEMLITELNRIPKRPIHEKPNTDNVFSSSPYVTARANFELIEEINPQMLTQYLSNDDLENPYSNVYFARFGMPFFFSKLFQIFFNFELPKSNFSYDIKCTDQCKPTCKDAMVQFQCYTGRKILKNKRIGQNRHISDSTEG